MSFSFVFMLIQFLIIVFATSEIPKFYPQGYHLDLYPDEESDYTKGDVTINIATYAEPSDIIELDADPSIIIDYETILVSELHRNDSNRNETRNFIPVRSVERVLHNLDTLRIHLSQKLERDITYQVQIAFETRFKINSHRQPFIQRKFFDERSLKERKFFIMDLTNNDCYKAFPCFNKLDYKCWISMTVRRKSNLYALTTSPVAITLNVTKEGSLVKDYFPATPPMSLSSLALIISDYKIVHTHHNLNRKHFNSSSAPTSNNELLQKLNEKHYPAQLTKITKEVLKAVEDKIGLSYPLSSFNVVMVPPAANVTFINAFGILVINETNFDDDDFLDNFIMETCNQWFNHIATPVTQNSTIRTLITHLKNSIIDETSNNITYKNHMKKITYSQVSFMELLQSYIWYSKTTLDDKHIFDGFVYNIFERSFTNFMSQVTTKFLQKKQFKLYNDHDLWFVFDEVLTKRTNKIVELKYFMAEEIADSWIQNSHIPVININKFYNRNNSFITINVSGNFMFEKYILGSNSTSRNKTCKFPIVPLVVSYSSNQFQNNRFINWISDYSEKFELDVTAEEFNNSEYFVANPGHIAPYIVNYEESNWRKLMENFHKLLPNIQLQLLVDSLVLADNEIVNYSIFLKMSSKLRVSRERLDLWYQYAKLMKSFEHKFHGEILLKYKEFISQQTKLYVNKISELKTNYNYTLREHKLILETAMRLNCFAYNKFCFGILDYDNLILQVITNKRLKGKYNCEIIRNISLYDWQVIATGLLHTPLNSEKRSDFLHTLSCTENPIAFETYMNLLLLNFNRSNLQLTSNEQIYVISRMDYIHSQMLLEFVDKNFHFLKERLNENVWTIMLNHIIRSARSPFDVAKMTVFQSEHYYEFGNAFDSVKESLLAVSLAIQKNAENIPMMMKLLDKVIDEVNHEVKSLDDQMDTSTIFYFA